MSVLLVALGAAVGASLRFLASHHLDTTDGRAGAHWGTLGVNVAGSLLLGWLVGHGVSDNALTLLGTGFCGALTTYSALAVQAVGHGPRRGTAYAIGTVLLCFGAAWLGLQLG